MLRYLGPIYRTSSPSLSLTPRPPTEKLESMSCNGCRVLRKGCSENCVLRPCIQWIASPESQGYATVFVAKFFGRAGLMSFISAVPESQRPGFRQSRPGFLILTKMPVFAALFQSLLFEAAGRTVNPVNGAVGLLWAGNWSACQAAVDTILRGGTLCPLPEILSRELPPPTMTSDVAASDKMWKLPENGLPNYHSRFSTSRSRAFPKKKKAPASMTDPAHAGLCKGSDTLLSEDDSVTTTFTNGNYISYNSIKQSKLLNLFS